MRAFSNHFSVLAAIVPLAAGVATAQTSVILPGPSGRALVKFEIRVPPSVRNEPLTGRVYAIISRDSTRDPRAQVGRVGTPLFGHDVERLLPGAPLPDRLTLRSSPTGNSWQRAWAICWAPSSAQCRRGVARRRQLSFARSEDGRRRPRLSRPERR